MNVAIACGTKGERQPKIKALRETENHRKVERKHRKRKDIV